MSRDMWQFFEDDSCRLSMTRLIVFLTFVPATGVLLTNPEQLVNYLGAYIGGYAVGKGADALRGKNGTDSQVLETSELRTSSVSVTGSSPDNQPLAGKSKRARRRAF